MKMLWVSILAILVALTAASCGDDSNPTNQDIQQGADTTIMDEGGNTDTNVTTDTVVADEGGNPDVVVGGLTPPDLRTTYVYRLYEGGSANYTDMPGLLEEEAVEYDGETWFLGKVGTFAAEAGTGLKAYVTPHLDPEMGAGVGFKAVEVYSGQATPNFWYSFAEPLIAYANIEVGVKQTVSGAGELGFTGADPMPMEASVEYTLVSKSASVEVPFGTVEGCYMYSVDAWEAMGGGAAEGPMHVDVWVKPDVGIVKISMVPGYDAMELVSYQLP